MVRYLKTAAVAAGALVWSTPSIFAQDLVLPQIDLDPFHIFTPAPPPPAAPAPPPVVGHAHGDHHHARLHHHVPKH